QRIGAPWFDFYGNNWTSKAPYNVFDADVSEINPPSNAVARTFATQTSTNMGLAVSATRIAVSGTDSRNMQRFEPRIVGYLVETVASFVTISSGSFTQRRLDPHIDYTVVPGTQA